MSEAIWLLVTPKAVTAAETPALLNNVVVQLEVAYVPEVSVEAAIFQIYHCEAAAVS